MSDFGRRKTGRKTSQFVTVSSPFTSYLVRLELNPDGLCSRIISELSEIHFLIKKTRLPNICKFRSIIDIRNEIVCIKDILLMVHSDFSFFYFQRTLCKRQKVSFKTLKLYLNCGHLMSNANILIPNYTYHNLKFLPMMLCSFWVNILTVIEQKAMLFKTLKLKISNF